MSRLQASLLGGLFIGVLSSLPIVNMLNLCCCLWVVSGGALTTYLLQQNRTTVVDNAEAAATGLLAGAIGALISGVGAILMFVVFGGDMGSRIRSFVEQLPQLPPEARDQLMTFEPGVGYVIFSSLLTVPIYAVFAMLGGLLALLFVRKPTPPAAQV